MFHASWRYGPCSHASCCRGRAVITSLAYLQGEAGVVVPDDGYLNAAHKLLKKHNALLIADEVQVGVSG